MFQILICLLKTEVPCAIKLTQAINSYQSDFIGILRNSCMLCDTISTLNTFLACCSLCILTYLYCQRYFFILEGYGLQSCMGLLLFHVRLCNVKRGWAPGASPRQIWQNRSTRQKEVRAMWCSPLGHISGTNNKMYLLPHNRNPGFTLTNLFAMFSHWKFCNLSIDSRSRLLKDSSFVNLCMFSISLKLFRRDIYIYIICYGAMLQFLVLFKIFVLLENEKHDIL